MTATVIEGISLAVCPFCGSEAKLKTEKDIFSSKRSLYFWAKCQNRDCAVTTKASESQDLATELWNTRAKIEVEA